MNSNNNIYQHDNLTPKLDIQDDIRFDNSISMCDTYNSKQDNLDTHCIGRPNSPISIRSIYSVDQNNNLDSLTSPKSTEILNNKNIEKPNSPIYNPKLDNLNTCSNDKSISSRNIEKPNSPIPIRGIYDPKLDSFNTHSNDKSINSKNIEKPNSPIPIRGIYNPKLGSLEKNFNTHIFRY